MKLTWFGGTTVRVHIGGSILVVDPEAAPAGIDRVELLSGADQIVTTGSLRRADLTTWRARKSVRLLDEATQPPVEAWSSESGAILLDAIGEPPLLLFPRIGPALGRWADNAVVAISGEGEQLLDLASAVLAERTPRLLVLAGDEAAIDHAVPRLRDHLDGAVLVALEAGMALEV